MYNFIEIYEYSFIGIKIKFEFVNKYKGWSNNSYAFKLNMSEKMTCWVGQRFIFLGNENKNISF